MKVILIKDNAKLGRQNDIVSVSDGYARNFLFPQKIAVPMTPGAMHKLKVNQELKKAKIKEDANHYLTLKKKLEQTTFYEEMAFDKQGFLIKNLSKKHLAKIIFDATKIKLEKSVFPKDYVFAAGKNVVPLQLFPKINANIELVLKEKGHK